MLRKTSEWIARKLIKSGEAGLESFEAYAYGTELFLIRVIFYAVLMILAFITDTVIAGAVFTLSYMLLRQYSGGFHCKTPLACLILSAVMFAAMAAGYGINAVFCPFLLISATVSAVIIHRHSPCETEENPLSDEEKAVYRHKARVWSLIAVMAVWAGYLTDVREICYPLSCSLTADAVLMIISIIKKRKCCL